MAKGEAIGYAYAELRELPEDGGRYGLTMLYLHHISVKPEYRRMKCGEALVNALKAVAWERKAARLALDV